MPEQTLVEVKALSKKFCRSIPLSMRYTFSDVMLNFLNREPFSDKLKSAEFWALKDIGFNVKRGEAIAIIGGNGMGKSTLLKMIQGIYEPDEGEVTTRGRMTPLVQLGAGFHGDYTGRENIGINASVLGLKNKEIRSQIDSIIDLADIGEFINSPVKFYSRGMTMRLAFSIAVHCSADIFLVDEVLAVGDLNFMEKCRSKIRSLIKGGMALLLATHNLALATELCPRAIWLHHGKIREMGETKTILEKYSLFSNPASANLPESG